MGYKSQGGKTKRKYRSNQSHSNSRNSRSNSRRSNSKKRSSGSGARLRAIIIFALIIALLTFAIVVAIIKPFGIKETWYDITNLNSSSETFKREKGKKAVCIDPGHGFDDAGAASKDSGPEKLYERDVNADVAVRVKRYLEEEGIQVLLTYDADTKPDYVENGICKYSLEARTNKANSASVDLFVSIHCNSYEGKDSSTANGTRIYYYDSLLGSRGRKSEDLSKNIRDGISDNLPGRGSKLIGLNVFKAYQVIRETDMPGALVEIGFISDDKDLEKLSDNRWRDRMARGIADGIVQTLK